MGHQGMKAILRRDDLQKLFDALQRQTYQIYAPTISRNTVVLDAVSHVDQLPVGWVDHQEGGAYRLEKTDQPWVFGYVVGPQSWKKYLYPSVRRLYETHRKGKSFDVVTIEDEPVKRAFVGVRSCELHALAIHDKALTTAPFVDTVYTERRKNSFIVAVSCTRAADTCFCTSMQTGPKAMSGFDLALTEVVQGSEHFFLVEVGTEAGQNLLNELPHQEASDDHIRLADEAVQRAASGMKRHLDTNDLPASLNRNFDHPRWQEVSTRCLTCGNCTMVCPTCFCVTVQDSTSLSGDRADRTRIWDSCFTSDFSYIHGGNIRASESSRYRQWLMHKLAYWPDQFGTFGCVGCGRCITWCPVGIDITEEARIIRQQP
jgi:sulfhydrogenase subunit beta (sulfur reductase)